MSFFADGAPVWDDGEFSKFYLLYGGHEVVRSSKFAGDHKAMAMYMSSRPFLDAMFGGATIADLSPTKHW